MDVLGLEQIGIELSGGEGAPRGRGDAHDKSLHGRHVGDSGHTRPVAPRDQGLGCGYAVPTPLAVARIKLPGAPVIHSICTRRHSGHVDVRSLHPRLRRRILARTMADDVDERRRRLRICGRRMLQLTAEVDHVDGSEFHVNQALAVWLSAADSPKRPPAYPSTCSRGSCHDRPRSTDVRKPTNGPWMHQLPQYPAAPVPARRRPGWWFSLSSM
mmetsp:Transcript_87208/g.279583  ORF Transcript_87208/g.279583 Transcript_87208/m.279583 type:complete len:214 (+) Transcript_87208:397-1038(+)